MAHIRIIEEAEATGELKRVYDAIRERPLPAVYRAPHGGPAGIQRAHSLDARLMTLSFAATGTMRPGNALSWAESELIATAASRTNQCLY